MKISIDEPEKESTAYLTRYIETFRFDCKSQDVPRSYKRHLPIHFPNVTNRYCTDIGEFGLALIFSLDLQKMANKGHEVILSIPCRVVIRKEEGSEITNGLRTYRVGRGDNVFGFFRKLECQK